MRLFDDLALDLEIEAVQSQSSAALAQTNRFLTEAERLIASATVKDLNAHQLIHIQELTNNCLGTVVAVVEVLSEIQASEDCDQKSFQLPPDLCGILYVVVPATNKLASLTLHRESVTK